MKLSRFLLAVTALSLVSQAQPPGRGNRGGPPRSPRESAPIDLTGYWVSVVSEYSR